MMTRILSVLLRPRSPATSRFLLLFCFVLFTGVPHFQVPIHRKCSKLGIVAHQQNIGISSNDPYKVMGPNLSTQPTPKNYFLKRQNPSSPRVVDFIPKKVPTEVNFDPPPHQLNAEKREDDVTLEALLLQLLPRTRCLDANNIQYNRFKKHLSQKNKVPG